MRSVTGYVDGKPIWTDHGPGYGGSVKLGGEMVQSGPRPVAPTKPAKPPQPGNCELTGKCHHPACTAIRGVEAARLYYGDPQLSLEQVGKLLGGRSHRSVRYLISLAAANEAAA